MRRNPIKLVTSLTLLMTFLLILNGCSKNFREPIAKFQQNTNLAATAISSYYLELNEYERGIYFRELLQNPQLEVLKIDRNGKPTPLLDKPFSQDAIQARIELIQNLSTYAENLSELAGNDSPERFKTNVSGLAVSLNNLKTTFANLSNTDTDSRDYITPISDIISVIGAIIVEKKREKALKQAILNADKPVGDILNFLERDLKKYVDATRRSGERQKLADLVIQYNQNRGQLSFNEREILLKEIEIAAKDVEVATASSPAKVVVKLRKAHQSLVKFATSPTPINLQTILESLDEYEDEVEVLVNSVLKIRELRRN